MGGGRTGGSRVAETRLILRPDFQLLFVSRCPAPPRCLLREEKGGVGAGRRVRKPGLPARPCGARASSGLLAAPLGGPRGERLPPAEMRAETRGTSRTLDLQPPPPPPARETRGPGVGWGSVPRVLSAVCPPRRRAPVSAAQTFLCGSLRFLSRCAFCGSLF